MPPQTPNPTPAIQVVTSGQSHGPKKLFVILFGLIILAAGIAAAIYIGQSQQRAKSDAWDCSKYIFNVTQTGQVSVTNNSLNDEPPQKVSVSINGQPAGIFDVPVLRVGDTAHLGSVEVPLDGGFTWETTGTVDCRNQGSYQAVSTPTPTQIPPTPTQPEETITPTEVPPVSTPTPTPIPPTPTVPVAITATSTPSSTPTSTPIATLTPTIVQPNSCNGTCGSNANCQSHLVCSNGFCRNPSCTGSDSCACAPTGVPPQVSTITPTPVQALPQSGGASSTLILTIGGLILLGFGILFAI